MFFPSIRTLKLSGRSLFPAHAGHIFSDQISSVPNPWHVWHAPYGLLNEKRRGSISGNEKPSTGQVNFAENDVNRAQAFSRLAAAQKSVDQAKWNLEWLLSRPDTLEVSQADAAIIVAQVKRAHEMIADLRLFARPRDALHARAYRDRHVARRDHGRPSHLGRRRLGWREETAGRERDRDSRERTSRTRRAGAVLRRPARCLLDPLRAPAPVVEVGVGDLVSNLCSAWSCLLCHSERWMRRQSAFIKTWEVRLYKVSMV